MPGTGDVDISSPLLPLDQSPCDFGAIEELDDQLHAQKSVILTSKNDLSGLRESQKSDDMNFSRDIAQIEQRLGQKKNLLSFMTAIDL